MPKPSRSAALPQPHDALFKWTFSQREHAMGLLKAALPKTLARAIDWSTLRLEKGSYVDRALRSRHSDLVFSARIRERRVLFYALIEQQRDVEPLMVLRMGIYMMRLWEQLVREEPDLKAVPPIFPLLIHHSDTGWTAATAFQDIVAVDKTARPALLPYIPCFELRLVDLSQGRASDLVEQALTALGQVVLFCLSVAGDDARLGREIGRLSKALDEVLRAPDGLAALEALLRYLLATHTRLSVNKLGEILEKAAGLKAQEVIVTVLDEIEQRGERRGEQRGERRGRAQMLLEQLAAQFGSVPPEMSVQVMAADETALTRWGVRVLKAPTLEDVFSEPSSSSAPQARRSSGKKPARRR